MKPIYIPKGPAKEYGDYAINIYTGCPHRCYYCFAPQVLHKDRETFHCNIQTRPGVVEAVKRQLEAEKITGKFIHLCFTCDPCPKGVVDTTPTNKIIELLKSHGNNIQLLTKGGSSSIEAIELMDSNDWYGITLTGASADQEPGTASPTDRIFWLAVARNRGIKTWVSFEPVVNADWVLSCIAGHGEIFDKIKIGKLNYHPSNINWKEFGNKAEGICKERGFNYYIKESLRKEMMK